MLSVLAKMPIKADKMDEALELIKGLIAKVAEEEGTLYYTVNVDRNNPNVLVFMERYKDKEALEYHSGSPHFQEFFGKAPEYLDGQPEIIVMKELAGI